MTDKEMIIRVKILPQLDSLVSHLLDNGNSKDGCRLERIIGELESILDECDYD